MNTNKSKKNTVMLETYKKVKKLEHKIETDQYLELGIFDPFENPTARWWVKVSKA